MPSYVNVGFLAEENVPSDSTLFKRQEYYKHLIEDIIEVSRRETTRGVNRIKTVLPQLTITIHGGNYFLGAQGNPAIFISKKNI
ncbi:MAG: hypothetical protein GY750_10695 [Lentisphaerae bacterium]|nr:hypothetical protein [Lentisphaerota bacterium]MCP4101878.1 hypothetical protein [Lentisphaerota bacterium]